MKLFVMTEILLKMFLLMCTCMVKGMVLVQTAYRNTMKLQTFELENEGQGN